MGGYFFLLLLLLLLMALQLFVGALALFQFPDLIHSPYDFLQVGSARRKAATYTQNKRTHTSISRVGFEPTIPAFARAKTVHTLDLAQSL
jgi:hypothetical protein